MKIASWFLYSDKLQLKDPKAGSIGLVNAEPRGIISNGITLLEDSTPKTVGEVWRALSSSHLRLFALKAYSEVCRLTQSQILAEIRRHS